MHWCHSPEVFALRSHPTMVSICKSSMGNMCWKQLLIRFLVSSLGLSTSSIPLLGPQPCGRAQVKLRVFCSFDWFKCRICQLRSYQSLCSLTTCNQARTNKSNRWILKVWDPKSSQTVMFLFVLSSGLLALDTAKCMSFSPMRFSLLDI